MKLKTRVIEIEPGWLLLTFRGPTPPAEKRAFWLHRTLSDWLSDHPGRSVLHTQAVQHNGELMGVHVWLDTAPAATKRQPPIRIPKALAEEIPFEHLEAFLQHAYGILFQHPQTSKLAVVNRSGIAVVFDRETEQGHLLHVKELAIDARSREAVSRWLAAPESNYFVVEMSGFKPAN